MKTLRVSYPRDHIGITRKKKRKKMNKKLVDYLRKLIAQNNKKDPQETKPEMRGNLTSQIYDDTKKPVEERS